MSNSNKEDVLDLLRSKTIGSLNEDEKKLVLSTLGDDSSADEWHSMIHELHTTMQLEPMSDQNYQTEIARIKTEFSNTENNDVPNIFNYKVKLYKVVLAAAVISAVMFLFAIQNNETNSNPSGVSVKDHPFLTENFVQSTD